MYVKKKKCMDLLYPTKAKGTKNKLDNRLLRSSPSQPSFGCHATFCFFGGALSDIQKTAAKETTSQVNQPFCNKNLTDYITTVETIVSFLSRVLLSAHLLLRYND